jgi:hypothetical protein
MSTALATITPSYPNDTFLTRPSERPAPAPDDAVSNWMRQALEIQQTWLEAMTLSTSRALGFWSTALFSATPFRPSPFDWFSQMFEANIAIQTNLIRLMTRQTGIVVTEVTAETESFVRAMDVVIETPREPAEVKPIGPQLTSLAKAAD